MSQISPCVLVTRRLPEQIEQRMRELFDVSLSVNDRQLAPRQIIARSAGHSVIVSSITDQIDAQTIAGLPAEVRLIAQFGNGVDNVDVEAAHAKGITVTNTPSVLTEDTADMALALILSVPRRLVEGANHLPREGNWPGWSPTWMLGRRLGGKSLGIVGLGRIGTAVARRARAFGLAIHYYSRHRRPPQIEEELGATYWSDLDAMLEAVDIVSLHTPLTKDTFQLIDKRRLGRMRREAVLINVSRPELIDERALVSLIENGHLGGAGLDVFAHRRGIDKRLIRLARDNRVVLTPHMASATLESRIEMGETVLVNIRVFADGHKPPHRVLPDQVTPPMSRRAG